MTWTHTSNILLDFLFPTSSKNTRNKKWLSSSSSWLIMNSSNYFALSAHLHMPILSQNRRWSKIHNIIFSIGAIVTWHERFSVCSETLSQVGSSKVSCLYLKASSADRSLEFRPETGNRPSSLAARNTDRNSRPCETEAWASKARLAADSTSTFLSDFSRRFINLFGTGLTS